MEAVVELVKVASKNGYENVFNHPTHGLLVSFEEVYCEICDLSGGYCGGCSGAYWNEKVEIPLKEVSKFV